MIGSGLGIFASQQESAPSLLLDLYPSDTILAQSVRKLRTAYAGNAEEVRVDEVGQPQFNIGFNNEDLDEAALVANANGNDAFLSNWYDQENANNFLQSSAANQAQVVNSGAIIKDGGKPSVDFSTIAVFLKTNGVVNLAAPTEMWLFMALNITNNTNGQFIYVSSPNVSSNNNSIGIPITNGSLRVIQNNNGSNVAIDCPISTGFQILSIQMIGNQSNTNSCNVYSNGVLLSKTIDSSGTSPASYDDYEHYLGARVGGGVSYRSNISEVILKTGNQSANRAGIEANMAAYYGITI